MSLALRYARTDGRLPDGVHDHGMLDSSSKLTLGVLERLRHVDSPTLAREELPVMLPPLIPDLPSRRLGIEMIELDLE